ncbi:MAG: flavodoxin family protein [Actinomycetia bacterium]|nr:flavodoxin family protein [Actinomycetes bacterium]
MKVIIFYESRSGNTELAARHIGGICESLGVETSVRSVRSGDYSGIPQADLIFLGTWVDGGFFWGQRAGGRGALLQLPGLWDKPTALFATYAVNPGKMMDRFADWATRKLGIMAVTGQAFHRNRLPADVEDFVVRSLEAVGASVDT